jgi:hypothetical protein
MSVVLSGALKGEVVAVPQRVVPSHQNSTLVTPTLSEAVAVRVTVPLTVLPPLGAVKETAGGVVSAVEVPAWLTVKVLPAMVMVPVRELVEVLA